MKTKIALLLAILATYAQASDLPTLLREAATTIERIDAIEARVTTLEQRPVTSAPTETIYERVERQGFVSINDTDLEGVTTLERYNNAVQFILNNWGYERWENNHVPVERLPNGQTKYKTQQAMLPSVYFPPGNYDLDGTMWIHPMIGVFGAGHWQTRLWFGEGVYEDDRGWWKASQQGNVAGPITMLPVCIGVPCLVKHPNGQEWGGFLQSIRNLNIKFAVPGGQVGICVYGALTNARFERLHLVADTGRDKSIAINHVPQSTPRQLPWGTAPAYGSKQAGYSTHLLDSSFRDIMIEFWHTGIVTTGMGTRIADVRVYYTGKGLHIYGQSSGLAKHEVMVDLIYNTIGLADPDKGLAAVVSNPDVPAEALRIVSDAPVWHGLEIAPEARADFQKGERIW